MKIVLVGPNGSGKRALANALSTRLPNYGVSPDVESLTAPYAIGSLADYRTELTVAIDRVYYREVENFIAVNSLVDSFAHTAVRLLNVQQAGNGEDTMRWLLTNQVIAMMFRDSFQADVVFVLESESEEVFDKFVGEAMEICLKESKIDFTVLKGSLDENVEVVLKVVEENGRSNEGTDTSESSRDN